jgi:hypothetical protein
MSQKSIESILTLAKGVMATRDLETAQEFAYAIICSTAKYRKPSRRKLSK